MDAIGRVRVKSNIGIMTNNDFMNHLCFVEGCVELNAVECVSVLSLEDHVLYHSEQQKTVPSRPSLSSRLSRDR